MEKISDWIDGIIQDLVDPNKQLKDTLLKVQVLSFKLKNDLLKEWVGNELNGYRDKEIPEYRIIPAAVIGNLFQDRGFGSYATRNEMALPIEYLDKELCKTLRTVYISQSVSGIEQMISEKGEYRTDVPHFIYSKISKLLSNGWNVESAWQKITLNSLEGIISSIKSNLLNFLLELNQKIGDDDNYSIMENKKQVDNLFDKTIGSINGETINVSIGNQPKQIVNQGDNVNIALGENNNQNLTVKVKNDLQEFIKTLNENLEKLGLTSIDKEDIINEIQRIESQIKRDKPRVNIINAALITLQGILTGIAANAYTPFILEKLGSLLTGF